MQATTLVAPARPVLDGEGGLGPYFRDLSDHELMSADDELAAARTIAALRRELWTTLLGYPPFVGPITDLIRQRVPEDPDTAADLQRVCQASRALRDRDTRAHQDAFAAAQQALCERMLRLDVDGPIADELAAELAALHAGDPGERTLVVPHMPPQGSRPFAAYLRTIQTTLARLRAARARFVEANLRLVVVIARRYNRGSMSLADRIQEGNLGLIKAVCRFDPARGYRFSTYGAWWIRHAITRALADKDRAVRLPVHLIEAMHRLARARRDLRRVHGSEPADEAVAAHTGLSLARIQRIDAARLESTVSFDGGADEDGPQGLQASLSGDDEVPGERLDAETVHTHVLAAFAKLRPLEADILRQRFGLHDDQSRTLRELAAQYSLSRERIRQLQEQALGKIRLELRRRDVA